MKAPCDENTLTCHTEQWLVGVRGSANVDMTDTGGVFQTEAPIEMICALAEECAPIISRKLMLFTGMS